jgi:type IV secretion system protein VirB11
LPVRSLLSVVLPGGERGQVVRQPACVQGFSPITIRKHAPSSFGLKELVGRGLFASARDVSFYRPSSEEASRLLEENGPRRLERFEADLLAFKRIGDLEAFCRAAVLHQRNIVVSGMTFSGKTTLARALIGEVPGHERLVTIEDVHELELPNLNRVPLLFGEGEGRETAEACLSACMRLSPDRIFLAVLRGSEAWEYVMGLNTGHPGSVTTTHANSAVQTFERLASLVKNSPVGRGLERAEIRRELYQTLDVVLFMADWKVVEVFYDPIFRREQQAWPAHARIG